jgi:cell division inhibitor SepF
MIKTLRPRGYEEVIHVGHYFCHGFAVIMDLSHLTDAEAMSLVDFCAGLVVGRGGDLERVARKVFLLRPNVRAAA